jgi:hypothetical protein
MVLDVALRRRKALAQRPDRLRICYLSPRKRMEALAERSDREEAHHEDRTSTWAAAGVSLSVATARLPRVMTQTESAQGGGAAVGAA